MKTASIKRGSIVSNTVPVKEGRDIYPVGTPGQVLRVLRKQCMVMVKFRDGYGCKVPKSMVVASIVTNQKVPKVGDIFVSTWGYGQSNNTWFKVKSVKKNTVSVVRVGETLTYTESMAGNSLVNPEEEIGEVADKRVLYDMEGNPSFKMASYARAWLVEDIKKPRFFSEWN
jgi:hypothetical protein